MITCHGSGTKFTKTTKTTKKVTKIYRVFHCVSSWIFVHS